MRLVIGIEVGSKRLLRFIEHDRQMSRPVFRLEVAQELPQHVAEAEHRIELESVRLAGERRQRMVGAKNIRRAVDQKNVVALLQRGCRSRGLGFRGFLRGFGWHVRDLTFRARNRYRMVNIRAHDGVRWVDWLRFDRRWA